MMVNFILNILMYVTMLLIHLSDFNDIQNVASWIWACFVYDISPLIISQLYYKFSFFIDKRKVTFWKTIYEQPFFSFCFSINIFLNFNFFILEPNFSSLLFILYSYYIKHVEINAQVYYHIHNTIFGICNCVCNIHTCNF